jgi:hypothetical protein
MMHDGLDEKIGEATAIPLFTGDKIDIEQCISLRAADSIAVSTPCQKNP